MTLFNDHSSTSQEKSSKKAGFFRRLREVFWEKPQRIHAALRHYLSGGTFDPTQLLTLEKQLIQADVGMEATRFILEAIKQKMRGTTEFNAQTCLLTDVLTQLLKQVEQPLSLPETSSPCVILVVGVNGVGKTTLVGKLACYFQKQKKRILVGAADTFRAGAIEQLHYWSQSAGATFISKAIGGDSAAVAYDALHCGISRRMDVILIDTAGRLQGQVSLKEELRKMVRVLKRVLPEAPHEILLVLDATLGQNGLSQLKWFQEAIGVTGLAMTKLDGTAKGGMLLTCAHASMVPIRFICCGETAQDLGVFNGSEFVSAFLSVDRG